MKLEEVVEILPKSKIKAGDGKKEGKYPLYRSSNKIDTYYDEYLLDEEVIIVGTGGNPSIHYNTGKCAYTTQCLAITSKGTLKNKYIYYYLLSQLDRIQNMFRGMTIKQLDKKAFFKLDIPIIEVEIQDKIIENLDKISNNIQSKREQLKKLEQLVKSQFVEMFENNKFEKKNLGDVAIKITDGSHNPPKGVDERTEYVMLSSQNIIEDRINYNNARYLSREDFERENKRTYLKKGDVLLTIVGTIGRTAIIHNENNITLQRSVAVIKPIEEIKSEYLAISLKSDDILKQLNKGSKGVAQKGIYLNDLKKILIPFPPITLQNQFSEIVKQIDKQKFEIEKSLKETQELYESLMQEYYKQINVGIENNTGEIIKKDVTKNIVRRWL